MEREDWGRVCPGQALLPVLALAGLVMGLGACAKKHHHAGHGCRCACHAHERDEACTCGGSASGGRECACHGHGSCAKGTCHHARGLGEAKHHHGEGHWFAHEHGPGSGRGEGPGEPFEQRGPVGPRRFRLNPLRILDRRYALGEMDEEDYLRRRQVLLANATGPEGPRE